jgi:hypothetical protein
MYVAEKRSLGMVSLWGECQALRCRYRCRDCGASLSNWLDASLDESGCLPEVLMRAHELATLLPYRRTSEVLKRWGVDVGKSLLCSLNEKLNETVQVQGSRKLSELAQEPLPSRCYSGKTWMIEVDGKFVPVWTDEKTLEWREVKTAVLYPMRAPSERYYVSHIGDHEAFAKRVHGLLRHAGVRQEDKLIGLCDGALWIASLMGDLGVHRHILDVYHASTYFETLMLGLGWQEPEREVERRTLLRGNIDVQTWLNKHVPAQAVLNEDARAALAYLSKQARLDHTCYPRFRAEGLEVIGSGQIEGANKSVIGARLNISGAHWSQEGAQGMVFARAEYYSHRVLTDFHQVRHQAFPRAA